MSAAASSADSVALLELRHVSKVFRRGRRGTEPTLALDDVSFSVPGDRASVTAIAGESGSGKSTLAGISLGFLAPTSGEARYRGQPIAGLARARGIGFRRQVQAILQDPYDVYNPFYRVDHVFDIVMRRFHLATDREQARQLIEEALVAVGLDPGQTLGRYPHQLSGGQAQRLMVARAFLLKPRLIVADEPVSMVDASQRAAILDTMLRLKQVLGTSFLYITHDLATAYQISDEILVLHEGRIVEQGPTRWVIDSPADSYTRLLVESIPEPDPDHRWRDTLTGPGPALTPPPPDEVHP